MEKYTPHTSLSVIKKLIAEKEISFTHSSIKCASALGMAINDIEEVALNLTAQDFYKSMTSNQDHKIWQEVYRPSTRFGELYFKLTITDGVLVVSCKEL